MAGIDSRLCHGDMEVPINGVSIDSRRIVPGNLFIAVPGRKTDGHKYIENAKASGAVAILCESVPSLDFGKTTVVQTGDTGKILGLVCSNFYDHPSRKMDLIGITGTNGKTSTAYFIYQMQRALGMKPGLISTIGIRVDETAYPAHLTTPDPVTLQSLISQMYQQGCSSLTMEVSSHAIDQNRIVGLDFNEALFTNITHDHLDYHGTFKQYIRTKQKFFTGLKKESVAIINIDDRNGPLMVENTPARVVTYGLKRQADFKGKVLEISTEGLQLEVDGIQWFSPLTGTFNAYNLMACYAWANVAGFESVQILKALSTLTAPSGRFETVKTTSSEVHAIVDYAHTPDALANVLETIRKINRKKLPVITVIGCGGDRDRSKRPVMAKIAQQYSDQVILTSDNPRFEDPDKIISEMLKGISQGKQQVLSITDRKQAIKTGIKLGEKGAILLVAGKGHETYQEIMGTRRPFDDKEIILEALNKS
jgi:UDP-N-acetylmuramoyl-L-alanyl-D-glutamate--2,6-diaminopimelate ligase